MRKKKRNSHDYDVALGKRIRQIRWLKGMTQQQLADQIGCKFQQVQKYEIGGNRVSYSRLCLIAEAFNMLVEDLVKVDLDAPAFTNKKLSQSHAIEERELLHISRLYGAMRPEIRCAFADIGKALAQHT